MSKQPFKKLPFYPSLEAREFSVEIAQTKKGWKIVGFTYKNANSADRSFDLVIGRAVKGLASVHIGICKA